ncbi:DeoR/GlpR family DNA-binding transcription regulator [Deinococcus misasensis]|uniref:DeoR/GlpR family DNA-binding transcription regulator n=1 Tax=Deinococcus misasensis TaxID=392413 RepID=UPI000555340A|nr:DeoR/GlpR family DNA-binding transcription regulator [Deinococcus misasensis]
MATRDDIILSRIEQSGKVTVEELADLLGVSTVTIRSDLTRLSESGLIHRTRGGATKPILQKVERPLEETRKILEAEKQRIAKKAASMVQDGDTIFIDVGSTCTALARALPNTLQHVTIVTNGLNIALELEARQSFTIVVTGGTVRKLQHSLVQPYGMEIIRNFRFDKAFIGCNGVSAAFGISNKNLPEAEVKRGVCQNAREVYVLADHEKIRVESTALIAPLSSVTALITDHRVKRNDLQDLELAGLRVIVV